MKTKFCSVTVSILHSWEKYHHPVQRCCILQLTACSNLAHVDPIQGVERVPGADSTLSSYLLSVLLWSTDNVCSLGVFLGDPSGEGAPAALAVVAVLGASWTTGYHLIFSPVGFH